MIVTAEQAKLTAMIAARDTGALINDLAIADELGTDATPAGRKVTCAMIDELIRRIPSIDAALDAWCLADDDDRSQAAAAVDAARATLTMVVPVSAKPAANGSYDPQPEGSGTPVLDSCDVCRTIWPATVMTWRKSVETSECPMCVADAIVA